MKTKIMVVLAVILLLGTQAAGFSQQSSLSIERAGTLASLTLTGSIGAIYEVSQTDNLASPLWSSVTNLQLKGTSTNFTLNLTADARFYRARCIWPVNMVWIAPGSFVMGSPESEQDRFSDESPQTMVTLTKGFYIGRFLVTQAEYQSLMDTNPAYFLGDTNRPVETVSWSDATNFCAKLTAKDQLSGKLPAGWSYRLPTEAEWEYACRAGTTTRFSFGDDASYTAITNNAWFWDNSFVLSQPLGVSWPWGNRFYTTKPVGMKAPNPWGLYDMGGNVWEWCSDWYASSLPGGVVTDPKGPAAGPYHAFRGGYWASTAPFCRSASRGTGNSPSNFLGGLGFRVVLSQE